MSESPVEMRYLSAPIAVFMFLSGFTACEAQQAGPYLGESLRRVSPEDRGLIANARTQVLEQNMVGKHVPWSNPNSGHAGEVSLLRTFKQNGMSCGEVGYTTSANQSYSYAFDFCRTAEGWKLVGNRGQG